MTDHAAFGPRTVLVTGGAGFIGSNLVRWLLQNQGELRLVNLDLLTYAGNLDSLRGLDSARHHFVRGDIRDLDLVRRLLRGDGAQTAPVDAVLHLAAESHVDRSIMGPAAFVETNVMGTLTLLEACRAELAERARPFRFIQVSTDEVYGTLGPNDLPFNEETPLAPNSPYAASKAAADLLVRAYVETFALPAIVTRCSNNYGPYQFPEKLIPLMITRALRDETLPVYGDGKHVRDWIHVEDHARALWSVLTLGQVGRTYNIGGESETTNNEIVRRVLSALEKPDSLITYVADRLGHDRRYAMDISRMRRELDWSPKRQLPEALAETIAWYLNNRTWWERVLSEAYRAAITLYLSATHAT